METRKLISSIEFGKKIKSVLDTEDFTYFDYFQLRDSFDTFLKQPLSIHFFIPSKLVGGVWVVLEEPKEDNSKYWNIGIDGEFNHSQFIDEKEEYQEAKERVLFEGFIIDDNGNDSYITDNNTSFRVFFNKNTIELFDGVFASTTLEDLSKYNLTLTEDTAKKLGV